MSADVRLDPATLRWCADKLRADLLASLEFAANNTVTLGAYEDAEEVVDLATAAIEAIESAAAEAESRPPMLSEWVRACEGTALGEPGCGQIDWPEHQVTIDGTGAVAMRHPPRGDADQIAASTPAELRAALDRLAAEVPS